MIKIQNCIHDSYRYLNSVKIIEQISVSLFMKLKFKALTDKKQS